MKRRILHVITSLDVGGAQVVLRKLLAGSDRGRFEPDVVSLRPEGRVADEIRALGVRVRSLGATTPVGLAAGILRLARWVQRERPDLVHTWMYHGDLAGGLAARLAGGPPVLWGVRQGALDPRTTKAASLVVIRCCAVLSRRIPRLIACCSQASLRAHVELGYPSEKMVVVPNGFDLEAFHPDPDARRALREELGLSQATPLVGLVARVDPQKDHRGFLAAAGYVRARVPGVHFVLCGEGVTRENLQVPSAAGLDAFCHFLGLRSDIARIHAALDVECSSSAYGEGFPNVVGEAMSCAVPCAVTDVGESAAIVGDTGRVVPPDDPQALAGAIEELIALPANERERLGDAARRRIAERYALPAIVARWERLYEEILDVRA